MHREKSKVDTAIAGKRVLVLGFGVSGLWTTRWLAEHGARVTVSEARPVDELDTHLVGEMRARGVMLESGGHQRRSLANAEMIVLSPGIPHDMSLLRDARAHGAAIVGELELAGRLIKTPVIAVTGTNGKSTVTDMLGYMLQNAGLRVFVGGNIGTPLMAYAAGEMKADYVVAEVSSFQLDTVETFCPKISIILNITPDHLERYPDFDAYSRSKLKIMQNQQSGDLVILNNDDPRLRTAAVPRGVKTLRYGMEPQDSLNAFMEAGEIQAGLRQDRMRRFSAQTFQLSGRHNAANLLAAVLGGLALELGREPIQKTIDEYRGLPDRMEIVAEIDGVSFCNDSKATNVEAAVQSVSSFDRPLIMIAGGRHKGSDYTPLVKAAAGRVKKVVLLGEARDLLARAFQGRLPVSMAEDMQQAVDLAVAAASAGDVVLLAPACSSFDMFSSYVERGLAFKNAVERFRRD